MRYLREDAVSHFEEDTVAGHRIRHACAAEDGRIHGTERGDGHCQRNPEGSAMADDAFDYIGSDVL